MNQSDISIIICTRDRPEALKECLRSVVKSNLRPLEVLIVDQSDNGHAKKWISQLAQKIPLNLRYLHLDSVGHTKARNEGVKASRGNIVAFTDDDCLVNDEWLNAMASEFNNPAVNCVCGHTFPANHKDRPKEAFLSTLNHQQRRLVTGRGNPILIGRGNNMAFRKSDLLKLGGFNEQIGVGTKLYAGDDFDLFYRLLESGGIIVHTPNAVILHVQPDDWQSILRKKRGYSISTAAVLAARMKYGDLYAGLLLSGKIFYELGCLMFGGALLMKWRTAAIGWHSFAGSFSGMRYVFNRRFCDEVHRLSLHARKLYGSTNPCDTEPCELPH